jgi:hypothetical protein
MSGLTQFEIKEICEALEADPALWLLRDEGILGTATAQAHDSIRPLLQMMVAVITGLKNSPRVWNTVSPLILLGDYMGKKDIYDTIIQAAAGTLDRVPLGVNGPSDDLCDLGTDLWEDEKFVLQMMGDDPRNLLFLPDQVFQCVPKVLEDFLPRLLQIPDFDFYKAVDFAKELKGPISMYGEFIFRNRAPNGDLEPGLWIRSGGPLSSDLLASAGFEDLSMDRSLWKQYTAHCHREEYLIESFENAVDETLLSDVVWMTKRIEEAPCLFQTAAREVQRAIRGQVECYAPFFFFLPIVVEDHSLIDESWNVPHYNFLIAEYLGSSRLRQALQLYDRQNRS